MKTPGGRDRSLPPHPPLLLAFALFSFCARPLLLAFDFPICLLQAPNVISRFSVFCILTSLLPSLPSLYCRSPHLFHPFIPVCFPTHQAQRPHSPLAHVAYHSINPCSSGASVSLHIVKDNCHVKHEGLYCLLKIDFTPEDSYMIPSSMDTLLQTG